MQRTKLNTLQVIYNDFDPCAEGKSFSSCLIVKAYFLKNNLILQIRQLVQEQHKSTLANWRGLQKGNPRVSELSESSVRRFCQFNHGLQK